MSVKSSVGVVIPSFNAANFLPQAIESILNQTYPLDDIVVVDDGSIDNTKDVVKCFSDQGVRYIKQHNQGSAVARNAGVEALSTDYVTFLDTDDQWLPNKTAVQIGILDAQPGVGIVSGDQIFLDPERGIRKVRKFSNNESHRKIKRRLSLKNLIGNPSMVMIRRSIMDQVGLFDPELRFGDDWDMWLRIVAVSDAAFANSTVSVYRWHSKNQSQRHQAACMRAYRQISCKAINRTMSFYQRPFAYAYLLRHTLVFMHYKSVRFLMGSLLRRFRSCF